MAEPSHPPVPPVVLALPQFRAVLSRCAATKELVAEFDRLQGSDLSRHEAPIVRMIDDATGKTDADVAEFVRFVYDCVWLGLPRGDEDG